MSTRGNVASAGSGPVGPFPRSGRITASAPQPGKIHFGAGGQQAGEFPGLILPQPISGWVAAVVGNTFTLNHTNVSTFTEEYTIDYGGELSMEAYLDRTVGFPQPAGPINLGGQPDFRARSSHSLGIFVNVGVGVLPQGPLVHTANASAGQYVTDTTSVVNPATVPVDRHFIAITADYGKSVRPSGSLAPGQSIRVDFTPVWSSARTNIGRVSTVGWNVYGMLEWNQV